MIRGIGIAASLIITLSYSLPAAALGEPCTMDKQCASDNCVDGVCCATNCDKTCEACNLTGQAGTCVAIPAGTDPDAECLGSHPVCGAKCDGKRQCMLPPKDTVCGLCKACNGGGQCSLAPKDDAKCGVIDCDKLDTACKDFSDLTAERCAELGKCKPPNVTKTCTTMTNTCAADAGQEAAIKDSAPSEDTSPRPDAAQQAEAEDSGCSMAATAQPRAADHALWIMLALLGLAIVLRK